ncbi:MAG: GAF domain-containing protein [Candidatus Obscuribacterales bacterium]|nr:GAF domain-containing protein [Candidatus Obscuribacterales bacterium]
MTQQAEKCCDAFAEATPVFVRTVIALSHASSIAEISAAIKVAARQLAGADGATYVLNDGGDCYYADEDAISPLWKGKRFAKQTCISGWCMSNKQQVAIPDIYEDARIPHDAYRPTFVKSLIMTPVRKDDPIAAIGTYWAHNHHATREQTLLLQTLADVTAVAIENIEHRLSLEAIVKQRTEELASSRDELKQLAYVVSHELQEPLRMLSSDLKLLSVRYQGRLGADADKFIASGLSNSGRVERMLDAVWMYARIEKAQDKTNVQSQNAFDSARTRLSDVIASRAASVTSSSLPSVKANQTQLEYVFQELLENAIKFGKPHPSVHCTAKYNDGEWVFVVDDDGLGFDILDGNLIFGMFKKLHKNTPGTGMGLAICRRIIEAHGGHIWAQSRKGEGSSFCFTLPE